MNEPINLSELLRDPSEIRDLLAAYGERAPQNPKRARERLLEIVKPVGETRLVSTLFEFAQGFAHMLDEVLSFCEDQGVRILGQIQLKSEEALGQAIAL